MLASPFHTYAKARELAGYVYGDDRLLAAYASSDIKIYPYQIAAAQFAMRSPYLKGVILADEGSLGKTYEALLIATQRWYEGKTRQLLVLPTNLIKQWMDKIEDGFTLPYVLIDSEETFQSQLAESTEEEPIENPFEQDELIITTYDFAVKKAECIAKIGWDVAIFDEADALFKPENKTTITLKAATAGAFKLLLTPTPITKDIMDVYGLLHFIDETILPPAKEFYDRYFRRPENYPELSGWVSQYCFRTLKSQVSDYVNFTARIPYTVGYELTAAETQLYEKLRTYIALPQKAAYPKIDQWELSLMYFYTVSSSPQALCRTLDGAISRIGDGAEKQLLEEIRNIALQIEISGKMTTLLTVLKKSFARLWKLGAKRKVIIFTGNRITQNRLKELLIRQGYKGVLIYNGQNSRDYSIMEQFRNEREAQILIATDEAAKGLDIEFCPVVINYDLLWNAVEMEQRITRCHRQGQQSDVLVINLLGKENLADVRILELINKRMLQFDGIFGLSDNMLGNFDADIEKVLDGLRHRETIKDDFRDNLSTHETGNKQLIANSEDVLFTTFTKDIADKITLTPEYIEEKIEALNARMWEVVRDYFAGRDDYEIDDEARMVTRSTDMPPLLFSYWTGSRNKALKGRKQYGIGKQFKRGDRITPVSPLIRGMMRSQQACHHGTIVLAAPVEPCEVGFFAVDISSNEQEIANFDVLCGQTGSGRVLTDTECREIFKLPVASWTEGGKDERKWQYWLRGWSSEIYKPHPLDDVLPREELIERVSNEGAAEEAGRIKFRTLRKKSVLEHSLNDLRQEIKAAQQELAQQTSDRMQELVVGKRVKALQQELRGKEQGLFFEHMRLDVAAEEEIMALSKEKYETRKMRHFTVKITGS